MRRIAKLSTPTEGICRLMIYETDAGTYLFGYTMPEDGPAQFDEWYESPQAAEDAALDRFHVQSNDWVQIDDPPPGSQHDWIRPTRVKRGEDGKPLWGQFESITVTG